MCPSVTAQLVAQGVNTVIYARKLSLTPFYYLFEIQPPGSLNSLRYQLLVPVPTPCKHVVLFAILFLCNYESCCLFEQVKGMCVKSLKQEHGSDAKLHETRLHREITSLRTDIWARKSKELKSLAVLVTRLPNAVRLSWPNCYHFTKIEANQDDA